MPDDPYPTINERMFFMKITLIAGSNRKDAASTNLLRYIERVLTTNHVSVELIDLLELPLPLYSPDAERLHPNVMTLQRAVAEADGLILATPEYHGSVSGALKNALDYLNGSQVGGKPVLSVSSAGGPLGVSSLTHLQTIVRNLHGINCPAWISIGYGSNSFGSDGAPSDEGVRSRVQDVVSSLVELTKVLAVNVAAVK